MLQKAKLNANLRVLLNDWPQQVSLLELEKNHFPQSKESTLNLPLPTLVPKSMVSCVRLNLNSCLSRTWGKTLCEICCQRTCDTHFQIKHAQLTTSQIWSYLIIYSKSGKCLHMTRVSLIPPLLNHRGSLMSSLQS